jgi:hypothetical protein
MVRCFAVTIAESGSHGNQLWFTREKGMSFSATCCETLSILLMQVKRNRWERTQNHARMKCACSNRGQPQMARHADWMAWLSIGLRARSSSRLKSIWIKLAAG